MRHGEPLDHPTSSIDDCDHVIVLRPIDPGDPIVGFQVRQRIGRTTIGDRQGVSSRVDSERAADMPSGVGSWSSFAH